MTVEAISSDSNLNNQPLSPLSRNETTTASINFFAHRIKFINALKNQNEKVLPKKEIIISNIYEKAILDIKTLQSKITGLLTRVNTDELSKADLKELKKTLKLADRQVVKIIHTAQLEVIGSFGTDAKEKRKIAILAQGGIKAELIFLKAILGSKKNEKAIEKYMKAESALIKASRNVLRKEVTKTENSILNQDRAIESKTEIRRRVGVIGINSVYRVNVAFRKSHIKNQIKSFVYQSISEVERHPINKQLNFNNRDYKTHTIPLNGHFDDEIKTREAKLNLDLFKRIFGKTGGISSTNRQEAHLVNGWETNLIENGKVIFRALRHSIISDKYEKDPQIRENNSKKAAEELMKAALLQELASQGLSIAEAQNKAGDTGLVLNINSCMLVTPDNYRPVLNLFPRLLRFFGLKEQADEKALMKDQVNALKNISGLQSVFIGEEEIKVNVTVNTFNFGVNEVAVGKKLAPLPLKIQIGLENQYQNNIIALKSLNRQIAGYQKIFQQEKENLTGKLEHTQDPAIREKLTQLTLKLENIKILLANVNELMANRTAYLAGNNPYEIGAFLLNLNYVVDSAVDLYNTDKTGAAKISGLKCSFNCMSGKDRTGIMDAVAKTLAVLANQNEGKYFSHHEYMTNRTLRQTFNEIFVKFVLEDSGLEITQLNTGAAAGYKVDKGIIFGVSVAELLKIQGASGAFPS